MQRMKDDGATLTVSLICFERRAVAAFLTENSRFMCIVRRFSSLRVDWKYAQRRPTAKDEHDRYCACIALFVISSGSLFFATNVFLFFLRFSFFLFSRFSHSFVTLFHLLVLLAGGRSTWNGGVYLLGYKESVFVTALQCRRAKYIRDRV